MEDVERTTRSKTKIIIVSVIVALAAVAGGSVVLVVGAQARDTVVSREQGPDALKRQNSERKKPANR